MGGSFWERIFWERIFSEVIPRLDMTLKIIGKKWIVELDAHRG